MTEQAMLRHFDDTPAFDTMDYPGEPAVQRRYLRRCACGRRFYSTDRTAAGRCLERHIAQQRHTQILEAGAL